MNSSKYVFVVSKESMQVIDTAKNEEDLRKRIPKKRVPYPKDAVFLHVDAHKALHSIETEEYEAASLIDNALVAAIIAGVDFDTALKRLIEKNVVSIIEVEEAK